MKVVFARALHHHEIDIDLIDLELEGKSWFYVELDNGDCLDLLAENLEQAKRYAVEDYSDLTFH